MFIQSSRTIFCPINSRLVANDVALNGTCISPQSAVVLFALSYSRLCYLPIQHMSLAKREEVSIGEYGLREKRRKCEQRDNMTQMFNIRVELF